MDGDGQLYELPTRRPPLAHLPTLQALPCHEEGIAPKPKGHPMAREYQPLTVQELVACTCDRCQRRLTSDELGEWQERLSFDHSCGFESVFGDGTTVRLDLCQRCVREVLGQWLHIETPEE